MIKRFINWFSDGNKQFKITVYDPITFNDIFDITASKIQIGSLTALFSLVVGFIFIFLIKLTPLEKFFFNSSKVGDAKLIEQKIRVDSLSKKIESQEHYINGLRNLMFSNFDTSEVVQAPTNVDLDLTTINESPSVAEQTIKEKIETNRKIESEGLYMRSEFVAPIKGKISQRFIAKKHEAIDIAVKNHTYFNSCLSGRVVFADYSKEDGNFIIIQHKNGFLSIYKHANKLLKKRGEKVKTGEKIGIAGNTGRNSTGTHLHFELWLHQKAVDPQKYIKF